MGSVRVRDCGGLGRRGLANLRGGSVLKRKVGALGLSSSCVSSFLAPFLHTDAWN